MSLPPEFEIQFKALLERSHENVEHFLTYHLRLSRIMDRHQIEIEHLSDLALRSLLYLPSDLHMEMSESAGKLLMILEEMGEALISTGESMQQLGKNHVEFLEAVLALDEHEPT